MLQFLNSIAVSFDIPILDWIQAQLQSPLMDKIWPIVNLFGEGGIFWIALAMIMLVSPKTRRTGVSMGIAMALGVLICNIIMKPLIARPRPYDFVVDVLGRPMPDLLVEIQHDYSFPSGHTIASFEACTALMENNSRLGVPSVILAIGIAFARLYLYMHYPTDVFVSVVLGIIFGIIGSWAAKKITPKFYNYRGRFKGAYKGKYQNS